eukprot:scaffold7840_cov35-Phaeocystis_antarctica.AAC.1
MGLRTGPIQEGFQPGPGLNRKARAGKDPKAHSRGNEEPSLRCGDSRASACTINTLSTNGWAARRVRAPYRQLPKWIEKRLQLLSVITKVYSLHFTNGNGKTNCGRHATIGTMASNYALARATLVTEEL